MRKWFECTDHGCKKSRTSLPGTCVVLLLLLFGRSCRKENKLFTKMDAAATGIGFVNIIHPNDTFNILDYAYYYNGGGGGEILPYHENKVTLSATVKDKWGLPVLSMDAEMKENEFKMRKDMVLELVAMFEAAGVKNITSWDSKMYAMGQGIHEMGTARMGRDPKTSVLNGHNQVWDAPNVFVTDGACMTSSACQNPSLTYMALTARAANFAVSELKKGNL